MENYFNENADELQEIFGLDWLWKQPPRTPQEIADQYPKLVDAVGKTVESGRPPNSLLDKAIKQSDTIRQDFKKADDPLEQIAYMTFRLIERFSVEIKRMQPQNANEVNQIANLVTPNFTDVVQYFTIPVPQATAKMEGVVYTPSIDGPPLDPDSISGIENQFRWMASKIRSRFCWGQSAGNRLSEAERKHICDITNKLEELADALDPIDNKRNMFGDRRTDRYE